MLLAVTDPPDLLADLTHRLAGHDRVLGTGTWLDSLRFRTHIAGKLDVSPDAVEAQILGEHGTSEVFAWSGVRVAGVPLAALLRQRGDDEAAFRKAVEDEVRYAKIAIIEATAPTSMGSVSSAPASPRRCRATRASPCRSAPSAGSTA